MAILKYMMQLPKKIYETPLKSSIMWRSLTTGRCILGNYEGDGKTTVTILNREHKDLVLINSFNDVGFRLNNGIFVIGPLAVFPRTVLQWNVSSVKEITPESLSLFCLLQPRLDLIIIGTGDKRQLLNVETRKYLKANKTNVEVLTTEHAIATFNFLNVEKRCIAGALLPPSKISIYEDEFPLLNNVDMDETKQLPFRKTEF